MSVVVQYTGICQATETRVDALSSSPVTIYDALNKTASYTGATTPAVTSTANSNKAMAAGAGTIDLTNIPGTNGVGVNGNGLKIQMYKFQAPLTNGAAITIKNGAASGYLLGGVAFSMTLPPGGEFQGYMANVSQSIGAGNKNLDLSGTGTDSINYEIHMG